MPREVLEESKVHPAVREKIATQHKDVLDQVRAAVAKHDVVVVGMAQNPHVRRACAMLKDASVRHELLSYGSYVSAWRERNVIKMWSGWPTFPMVFVKGTLVGGADDLKRLLESGELQKMIG